METDKATIPNLYAVPANRKFHRLYNIKILCRLWEKITGMCVLFSLHFELLPAIKGNDTYKNVQNLLIFRIN